ncbi:MAG: hypothetical protein ACK8QZ_06600, partial [Anaerolineales bacterium]
LLVDKLQNSPPKIAYLTPDLQLTDRGLAVLEHAPLALQDRLTSQRIEAILSTPSPQVTELIEEALNLVVAGDEDALSKILEELEELEEQPETSLKMRFR